MVGLMRYGISLAVAVVVGTTTFPAVLNKMGYKKKEKDLDIEDISDAEIEPDGFDE